MKTDTAPSRPDQILFPAPDPNRLATIQQWLSEATPHQGPAIHERTNWEPLKSLPESQALLKRARELEQQAVPALTDEDFLRASREGIRADNDRKSAARFEYLNTLVLAEMLESQGQYLPAIERGVEAILQERTWVRAAHDTRLVNFHGQETEVDLACAERAWLLALTYQWLHEKLTPELRKRIREHVLNRAVLPYLSFADGTRYPSWGWWWLTCHNNWNSVCNSGVVGAGLIMLESREDRARLIALAEQSIPYYFEGYADDGYCVEGMIYWRYGFSGFVLLAEVLLLATNNQLNLYQLPKVRACASYPTKLEISPGLYPRFSDDRVSAMPSPWLLHTLEHRLQLGRPDWLRAQPAIANEKLYEFALSPRAPDTNGESCAPQLPPHDTFPDSDVYLLRPAQPHSQSLSVALKGGHNGVSHNHNDLGSYVVGVAGESPLCDPGAEVYTMNTFSPEHRYDSEILSSYGHPVPLIAGQGQCPGEAYAATVTEHLTTPTEDRITLDLSGAYACPALQALTRSFHYQRTDTEQLTIRDQVEFSTPQIFESALITTGTFSTVSESVLHIYDEHAGVEVALSSEGAPLKITTSALNGELCSERTATRISLTLTRPVTLAAIQIEVRPLSAQASV